MVRDNSSVDKDDTVILLGDDRMSIEEQLIEWGCDVKGAMARFLDDTELYESCLVRVIEDENFAKLKEAMDAKDAEETFNCAHTLKGVLANMGLTPMYNTVCSIVEPVRGGDAKMISEIESFYPVLMEQLGQLKQIVQ